MLDDVPCASVERFLAGRTNVSDDRQTDRQTDRPRYSLQYDTKEICAKIYQESCQFNLVPLKHVSKIEIGGGKNDLGCGN